MLETLYSIAASDTFDIGTGCPFCSSLVARRFMRDQAIRTLAFPDPCIAQPNVAQMYDPTAPVETTINPIDPKTRACSEAWRNLSR